MSIYSPNRSGSANVVANENYTSNSFGRILYESEINDMRLFEGVLACDFQELHNLKEGTLLESEIAALNEASMATLLARVREWIIKTAQKIKGAIDNAITKFAAYVLDSGKAFAKNYRNAVKNYIGKMKQEDIDNINDKEHPAGSEKIKAYALTVAGNRMTKPVDENDITSVFDANVNNKEEALEVLYGNLLKKYGIGGSAKSEADFRKAALDAAFEETEYTVATLMNVTGKTADMLKDIETASESIAILKQSKKSIDKTVAALERSLKDVERAKKFIGEDGDVKRVTMLANVACIGLTASNKLSIDVVKTNMRNNRLTLTKALSAIGGYTKAMKEDALIEACDEFDCCIQDDTPGVNDNSAVEDPERHEALEEIIANGTEINAE